MPRSRRPSVTAPTASIPAALAHELAERTALLAQREAELAVINRIQQAVGRG